MSKRAYFHRYLLIIKKIKANPYDRYEEIESFINKQFEYFQEQDEKLFMGISQRTFQRDVKEIKSLFSIDIEYSTKNKGYFTLLHTHQLLRPWQLVYVFFATFLFEKYLDALHRGWMARLLLF